MCPIADDAIAGSEDRLPFVPVRNPARLCDHCAVSVAASHSVKLR